MTIKELDKKKAKEIIDARKSDKYEPFKKYFDGDHWQNGAGWVGPRPDPTVLAAQTSNSATVISSFNTRIRKQFVSKNVISEVVVRHVNGTLSRPADIQFLLNEEEEAEDNATANTEEAKEINLLEEYFREWMENRGIIDVLREGLELALLGERAVFRIYIPAGLADDNGILSTPEEFDQALEYISIEALPPDQATVYRDPDTLQEFGIYAYKDTNDDDKEKVEITYVNEADGLTYVKVVSEEGEDEGEGYSMGGRIMMFEISRKALITEQIRQNQDLLNKNLTMWSANLDWSGFSERMILNGMPPGKWKHDATTNQMKFEEGGEMVTGPSRTNYVMGQPIFNSEGKVTGFTNPDVRFREPIDVQTFDRTLAACYTNILEEAKQAHILLNSEAAPSGVSRSESRQDYQDDLKDSKRIIDQAGKWMLESIYLIVKDLLGEGVDKENEKYRGSFSATLQVGTLSAEEQQAIITQVDNKLLSPESAMRRLGIDDVEAELSRIDSVSEQIRELVEILNEMGVESPSLNGLIIRVVLRDKAEHFGEDLGDPEVKAIESEVVNATESNQQASALIRGAAGPVIPTEEEEEED